MENGSFEEEKRQELVRRLAEETDRLPWLYIDDFQAGDILDIKTQKRAHSLRIVDPKKKLVDLLFFDGSGALIHEMAGKFLGSVLNENDIQNGRISNALVKYSGIAIGFSPIILLGEGRAFMPSPIREVSKDGKILLPDLSKIPSREK